MKKQSLIKKIRYKLLYCLFFSDFLLVKFYKKKIICIKQVSTVFILELIHSFKIFSRLIVFSKKFCKNFSFLYPDIFYIDILRNIFSRSKFFKKFFFSSKLVRFDVIQRMLSLHFLPFFKFLDNAFQKFLKSRNLLLFFGLGFFSVKSTPGRFYYVRSSFDDFKKIIFLGVFLLKNLSLNVDLKNSQKLKF